MCANHVRNMLNPSASTRHSNMDHRPFEVSHEYISRVDGYLRFVSYFKVISYYIGITLISLYDKFSSHPAHTRTNGTSRKKVSYNCKNLRAIVKVEISGLTPSKDYPMIETWNFNWVLFTRIHNDHGIPSIYASLRQYIKHFWAVTTQEKVLVTSALYLKRTSHN